MAWKEVKVENQREIFTKTYLEGKFTISELCRQFEISRKTGYKWINRFQEGDSTFQDRSRAPHHQVSMIKEEVVEQILSVRFAYPTWGPRKILGWLQLHYPENK